VPLSNRCNEKHDCKDDSDEIDCEVVMVDKKLYHKEYPAIAKERDVTKVSIDANGVLEKYDKSPHPTAIKEGVSHST
jgi:hypothetical protein